MTRKINLKHVSGKANTFKAATLTKKSPAKAAAKVVAKPTTQSRGRRKGIEYKFGNSGVYAALKYLAETQQIRESDAEFGAGLAASIVAGRTSPRMFMYAKKLVVKKDHREALIGAGFDLGELIQEQFVDDRVKEYVDVSGTYMRTSDSGLAIAVKCAGRRHWLPLSQCVLGKNGLPDEGERVTLKVTKWLAEKNQMVAE